MAELKFFASVKERVGTDSMVLRLEEPMEVRQILNMAAAMACVDPSILINNSLLYSVNQEIVALHSKVEDKDEVAVIPPLSGGT